MISPPMKLKFPDSNVDFIVGPSYFLGDFDVYDREETLGAQLARFDPNDLNQLRDLLRERFFEGPRVAKLSAEHKKELLRVLASALEENFDFSALIEPDINSGNNFALPDSWAIKDSRVFFAAIYHQACLYWKDELQG